MTLRFIQSIFTTIPYGVLAILLLTYIRPCHFGRKALIAWLAWFVFCASKFICFRHLGGDVFYPELPELVMWFWNWAYSGLVILMAISLIWWHRSRKWLLPIVAWGLSGYGLWCGVKIPDVHEETLAYKDLPRELDGYRIVQISDIHTSSAARRWRTQAIVDMANALHGDLMCVTGDYTDGRVYQRARDIEPIKDLKARDGVYFITGNHEFYFHWDEWKREYERLGLRFLMNECVFPHKGLALAGVNDEAVLPRRKKVPYDLMPDVRQAFAAATNGEFRVLMQHRPGYARDNAKELNVRLQLSGHTHGGIMPILSTIVKYSNKGFVRGLYWLGESCLLVHTGSGQWAGFPMRFFDPSEIAVITLRRAE